MSETTATLAHISDPILSEFFTFVQEMGGDDSTPSTSWWKIYELGGSFQDFSYKDLVSSVVAYIIPALETSAAPVTEAMSFFEQQLAEIKKQTSLAVELINDKLVNDSESIKNIHSKKAILLSKVAAKMPQSLDVISKYNNTLISLKFLGEHLKRFQEQVTTWAQKLSDVIKEFLTEMESELSGTTQAILGTVKKAKNAPLLTKLLEKAQKIQSDGGDFLERLGGNHTEFEGIKSEDLTDYYYQCGSKVLSLSSSVVGSIDKIKKCLEHPVTRIEIESTCFALQYIYMM